GRVGGEVGTALDTFRIPYAVVEVDPDIVETLSTRGIFCVFGDATHERVMHDVFVESASLVILTLPDGRKNELAIRRIRDRNPLVPIVARAHSRADHEALLEAGATEIIQPELEASATLIRLALDYLKLPPERSTVYLERFREALGTGRAPVSGAESTLPEVYE